MSKTKSVFDHLNAIYTNQRLDYFDSLTELDKKTFSVYLINIGISMNMDFVVVANEVNRYWDQLKPRDVYLFYSQLLPKQKRFDKWIKKSVKSVVYDDWLVDRIMSHFEVSKTDALQYLQILFASSAGQADLRQLLESYGTDTKLLKQLKV